MLVLGVNHVETNMATYASVAITGLAKLNGVGAISDSDYKGSAEYIMG